jgi:hypothetical protein
MEIGKLFEGIFRKTPGLDLVIATMSGLMVPLVVGREFMEDWWLLVVPGVWLGALALSRVSGNWDDYVFDPLYGSQKTKQKEYASIWRSAARVLFPITFLIDRSSKVRLLDQKRHQAVLILTRPLHGPLAVGEDDGLYKVAQKTFEGREEWEDKVKSRLEYSKAARVFILPLLIQFIWELLRWAFGWPRFIVPIKAEHEPARTLVLFFQNPATAYLIIQMMAFAYLYLRIAHMSNLYDLIIEPDVFKFEVDSEGNRRTMISIGGAIVPLKVLSGLSRRN